MDVRSILVNVDLDPAKSTSLRYAIDLAKTFDARLIGVAADYPNLALYGMDAGAVAVDFYTLERGEIETQLKRAEATFKELVPATIKSEWHAYIADPVEMIIEIARLADLIVTNSVAAAAFKLRRKVDLGHLVLASGRPVIDVAGDNAVAKIDKVLIGWKDTREARRAVADALPILQRAREVSAVTVAEGGVADERSSLDDLVTWLARHGVTVQSEVINNPEGYIDVLESTALSRNADLVVTGGYGHSRFREWLFGGMTQRLLEANSLNRFFSN
jgi:nucleotide-binding universal stress UspA family protein